MSRVAIVGAGPSGLFCAKTLIESTDAVTIDIYERLEQPFGLLRFGVAPDHTTFNKIQDMLGEVLKNERVTLHTGKELGVNLHREQLIAEYDAVVYAVGAPADWTLEIPGDDLAGSVPAADFTRWYNGHPECREFDLTGVREAVVVGLGNVAMDACRLLAAPAGYLAGTKASDAAQQALDGHIAKVTVLGRRGPQHAAFTTPELRELTKLDGVQLTLAGTDVETLKAELEVTEDKRIKQNLKVMIDVMESERLADPRCELVIHFWCKPIEVKGHAGVESIVIEGTQIVDGRVTGTGKTTELPTQLVVAALGSYGVEIPGLPQDPKKRTVCNDEGKLLIDGIVATGEFVTGWARRGATGIIGNAKSDAQEVAGLVKSFLEA
ncbi:MAG: FAD-dependent oxidoreductase [Propionibacteriaceae bacterium]